MINRSKLSSGIAQLGIVTGCSSEISSVEMERDKVIDQLVSFTQLIKKWNRTHNLTAVSSDEEMLTKHLLDSLSILPLIDKVLGTESSSAIGACRKIMDIGSGAGLPAIPLAIVNPLLQVFSVDASQKRIAFQNFVSRELKLENLYPRHERIERFQGERFDCIVSRAFASISEIVLASEHLQSGGGKWLLMKGIYPQAEVDEFLSSPVSARYQMTAIDRINVPYLEAERHLVIIESR